ncbi:hypothetical protein HYPSUDRAFT_38694 [Hypholoma sublateritium FD-334 SS-4]|uniref:Cell adhesion protein byn-1 n=1 Tax=Hypholoma sublateritium (strain FD-334 SS-4) TaxID=945553 RepID=A0A0D2P161_HYPSF|nr:hypothetical protein HYPSUDRAFT_38694 [Hypholoma sublateritium FD-334 SS-4]
MPRAQKSSGKSRHDPLIVQLDEDEVQAKYGRLSQPGKRKKFKTGSAGDDEDASEVILDPKTSRRIFELARDQQDELEMPEDEDVPEENDEAEVLSKPRMQARFNDVDDDDDHSENGEDIEEEYEIDAGDMEALDAFLPANAGERKTLADLIFAKLDSGEVTSTAAIKKVHQDHDAPDPAAGLNPAVVEAYTKIGLLLKGYKSGPLPKLFKVIPSLPAWARMLALTHPENWSPNACEAATKIFISNMKPAQAQLFLGVVLLDAVRQDILENKKMNVHYFQALKKSMYKPGAFFKGFIFPLLDQGCTLKEATIVASILARTKVPVLHASAALLRIAEMDYAGPNSLFIRVLIDKKFELPYQVLDALVFHFIRLSNSYKAKTRGDSEKLPVLWHQSLLVFTQRYASDLTPDQKNALLDVIRATPHPQISPEIRRELVNSVVRGAPRAQPDQDVDMS